MNKIPDKEKLEGMKFTGYMIDQKTRDAIKFIAKDSGRSFGFVVRHAVNEYYEEHFGGSQ